MSLADVLAADRRGIILRVLLDQGDFALNEGVLQDALEQLGHKVSRDVIRTELGWLEEQGLISVAKLEKTGNLWIANITKRGEDVARGRAQVHGVKRPEPRA